MKTNMQEQLIQLDKIKKQFDLLIDAGIIQIEIPGVLKDKSIIEIDGWIDDIDYIWEKYNAMLKKIIWIKWRKDNKE